MDIGTKPEFQHVAEPDVMAALDNPDSPNPIAIEVGRLVAAYTQQMRSGPVAPAAPRCCAIEAVAWRLAARLAGLPVAKSGT